VGMFFARVVSIHVSSVFLEEHNKLEIISFPTQPA
jgi:hypothetical protein